MTTAADGRTMNRLIHGAVRRDVRRLAEALEADPDQDRAVDLLRAYRFLRAELTRHHEGEDTHIWPMMARLGADTSLLEQMESEHEAMADALGGVEAALVALASAPSRTTLDAAREEVATMSGIVDAHLRHEEDELEPVLVPMTSTPEWAAVEKKLRGGSVVEAGRFFAWLTDDMSAEEKAFLGTLVPPPVTGLLSRLLGRRYSREIAPVWA
ncbi:hemerythrin domain-containing protein [Nocardioides sp.]|uniref:hemerythrin domain-containing protein n=1 Tax=Nocardioides sp. TaxID=35761 RepID=UPI003513CEE1